MTVSDHGYAHSIVVLVATRQAVCQTSVSFFGSLVDGAKIDVDSSFINIVKFYI